MICFDEFSGALQAFPQTNRTVDANISAQRCRDSGGQKLMDINVKTDCAAELVEAVKYFGWLPSPGIPHVDYHNAKLERIIIRSIKEGVRSIYLKAGFPHELWPRSIQYFCTAHSFSTLAPIHKNEKDEVKVEKSMLTCYEAADGGAPFKGWKIPLGALVYYKPPRHRELPAFSPRTFPGIFVGWRVDAGFVQRDVHLVLDYESVRSGAKGFGRPIQVYSTEMVEPSDGNFIFPLYEASVAKLNLFKPSITLPSITERESLPFEGTATSADVRKRRTYVTLERAKKSAKLWGAKVATKSPRESLTLTRVIDSAFFCTRRAWPRKHLRKGSTSQTPAPETPGKVPRTPARIEAPSVDEPSGAPETPAMPLSMHTSSRAYAPECQSLLEVEAFIASCHAAPGEQDHAKGSEKGEGSHGDFREYDSSRSA